MIGKQFILYSLKNNVFFFFFLNPTKAVTTETVKAGQHTVKQLN